jgi:hypothetical protein
MQQIAEDADAAAMDEDSDDPFAGREDGPTAEQLEAAEREALEEIERRNKEAE